MLLLLLYIDSVQQNNTFKHLHLKLYCTYSAGSDNTTLINSTWEIL
jgi:hypothetical protein